MTDHYQAPLRPDQVLMIITLVVATAAGCAHLAWRLSKRNTRNEDYARGYLDALRRPPTDADCADRNIVPFPMLGR